MLQNKNILIIIGIVLLLVVLVLAKTFFGDSSNKDLGKENGNEFNAENTTIDNLTNYYGSYNKGNYIWGGAMNLAWNELSSEVIKEKIKLVGNAEVQKIVEKLNNPPFEKKDLDEKSYYIKSGYGQETVNLINKESKEKFPTKSFDDLKIKLSSVDIISYAYFLKEVKYKEKFKEEKDFTFDNKKVLAFTAKTNKQKETIKVLKYENKDKFIVKIDLKDNSDELILAKGYDMKKPSEIVKEINKYNKKNLKSLEKDDIFITPKLHLDYHRDYKKLIKKYLGNKNFTDYQIAEMFENIKFDMDEEGARVENEAVIVTTLTSTMPSMEPEEIKEIIFDKPYWVVMKRKESKNPYFILGINNSELMIKNKVQIKKDIKNLDNDIIEKFDEKKEFYTISEVLKSKFKEGQKIRIKAKSGKCITLKVSSNYEGPGSGCLLVDLNDNQKVLTAIGISFLAKEGQEVIVDGNIEYCGGKKIEKYICGLSNVKKIK